MTRPLCAPSWYEILGVPRDASAAEVRRAHRELVAELDKETGTSARVARGDDKSSGAGKSESKTETTGSKAGQSKKGRSRESSGGAGGERRKRRAEADAAFAVLRDPTLRREHDGVLDGDFSFLDASQTDPDLAGRSADACGLCGGSPVAEATLLRVTGAVLLWKRTRVNAPLCRPCGLAVYRSFQDHSLKAGWWGVAAVFYNAWATMQNLVSGRAYSRLDDPEPPEIGPAPSPSPLDPSPPLVRRSGPWFSGVLAAALLVALVVLFWPGGGFSSDPADYIPDEVSGKTVDPESEFARGVIDALDDPDFADVNSGTVGGGGTGTEALPDLVLAAGRTRDPKAIRERLEKDFEALKDKVDNETIDGVDVQVFDIASSQGGLNVAYAFGSPDGEIVLWSIAFEGGRDNAIEGMKAMIEAGSR